MTDTTKTEAKASKDDDGKVAVTALKQHLNVEGGHVTGDQYKIAKADAEKLIARGVVLAGHKDAKAVEAALAKAGSPEDKAEAGAAENKAA